MATIKINYFPIVALTVLGTSSRYTNMNEIYVRNRITHCSSNSNKYVSTDFYKCPVCGASCRKTQQ